MEKFKGAALRDVTDKPREECGIFGIYQTGDETVHPAYETYTALYALQHRGQESCGIAVNDCGVIRVEKDLGLVNDVFSEKELKQMDANAAIGHVRYSTQGQNTRENAQPIVISHIKGNLAVAHNGNLLNAQELREEIELEGGIFHTSNDSEIIAYSIVQERLKTGTIEDAVRNAMTRLEGAYSIVIMSPRKMIAARDPVGFRPICMGRLGQSVVFASESCALDAIGAEFTRDLKPGEIVVCEGKSVRSIDCGVKKPRGMCVFEYVYFARPDSVIDALAVDEARQDMGRYLAKLHPVDADVVIGVPDSGLSAAIGYSRESGIPYSVGLIKNRYIARTFIQPTQSQRERSVSLKLNPLKSAVQGKRVVMVDDSIVRGTTSANLVKLLRNAGATEVHMRVSSPPFTHPCFFGTDIPDCEMLIAHNFSISEIREKIGVDSIGYLNIEALKKIQEKCALPFCLGCFSGEYPVKTPESIKKNIFERRLCD